ncbi:MAG: hypothetical protein IPG17_27010 [Sandaracinaceae bacterium]|nr:hypothetical protein [Sandaracinaceae bacterium]
MTHTHESHPRRLITLRTLAVVVLLANAGHAAAQRPAALSREAAQQRRQLTAQATQLRRSGDHAGALGRAREAAALGSTPALRRLIAEELEATGDPAYAYQEFDGCMTEATAGRDRASLRACRLGKERLAPQLEWVRFAPVDEHQGTFRVFAHGRYQDPSAVPIAGPSTEIRIEAPLRNERGLGSGGWGGWRPGARGGGGGGGGAWFLGAAWGGPGWGGWGGGGGGGGLRYPGAQKTKVPQPSDEGRAPSARNAASGPEQVVVRRRANPGRRSFHLLTLPALGLSGDLCLVRATGDSTLDVVGAFGSTPPMRQPAS